MLAIEMDSINLWHLHFMPHIKASYKGCCNPHPNYWKQSYLYLIFPRVRPLPMHFYINISALHVEKFFKVE